MLERARKVTPPRRSFRLLGSAEVEFFVVAVVVPVVVLVGVAGEEGYCG